MALISLAALGVGCGDCGGEGEAREREPLSLIPADAWVVGSVDMGPLRGSPAYKRVVGDGNPASYYLGSECDYDPLPHIDKLWIGGGDDLEKGRGVIVAFGPLDRDKILGCFRDEMRQRGLSLDEEEMEGVTVFTPGPGRPHLAWLDAKTLVVADRDTMGKVLALEKGQGSSVRNNQVLYKLWERVARGRDLAVVSTPNEATIKRAGALVPDAYAAVDTTEQVALGMRFMKGLDLYFSLRLEDGDDAARLADRIESDVERWQNNDYIVIAGLSSHLKALNIERAGPEVTASAHLSERQVDSLTRLAVDSIDEIMRDGRDPEALVRERLRSAGRSADAGSSDGAPLSNDGAPTTGDAATR